MYLEKPWIIINSEATALNLLEEIFKYGIIVVERKWKAGENMGTENLALLSSRDGFTVFQFGKYTIRFRAPYSLERYTEVRKWDNGYLVVMAKYTHNTKPEEEYIDLVPILKNLFFDAATFLAPIKGVKVCYE